MGKDIYLTDDQYKELLVKVHEKVNRSNFKPSGYDSTETGNKYTETNCGLCNDNFTTKEMALFPEAFPGRREMKYRKDTHKCPFDMREGIGSDGCFYTCTIFKERKYGRLTKEKAISLVDKIMKENNINKK